MSNISYDVEFPAASRDEWRLLVQISLGAGRTINDLQSTTLDALDISPLYVDRPGETDVLAPDVAANARPIIAAASNASITKNSLQWDNRLSIIGSTTTECHEHAMSGLSGGVNSLELWLSDRSFPKGKTLPATAVAIAPDISELTEILTDVQLDVAPISLRAGASFSAASLALKSIWSARGHKPESIQGAFNADPIGSLLNDGWLTGSIDETTGEMALLALETARSHPQVRSVLVDVAVHHNAGASTVQELVAAIATASQYTDAMLDAGLSLEQACNTISFRIACDSDVLMNVAKIRSLRQLWQHTVSSLASSRSTQLQQPKVITTAFDVETSRRYLSRIDPWVNHLRNIAACSAAALTNSDAILVHPHNLIDGVRIDDDSEIADRVARNLPIILAEESSLNAVHDPMAGSYAIEHITDKLNQSAWQQLGTLQSVGGLADAITKGHWQQSIADMNKQRMQGIEEETTIMVGVNRFQPAESSPALKGDGASTDAVVPGNAGTTATPLEIQRLTLPNELKTNDQGSAVGSQS
ncbi:MAG: methylmalonyl-CoA mutase family protein [Granulosicoccus sp.]